LKMMSTDIANFEQLEDLFTRLASPGIRPGLERVGRLLDLLGNPESKFPAVHVVGTNGKGSTAAFTERMLRESGYRTALYTSPHLESPSERLLLNGEALPVEEWAECARIIEDTMIEDRELTGDPPTFFELVTAAAFMLCEREGVEIAVVEAGLGGRLDATNMLKDVRLTLVTSISMDHTEFLGDTIELIAKEKFAVMRSGVPAIFSGNPPELSHLFFDTASRLGAVPLVVDEVCAADNVHSLPGSLSYTCTLRLDDGACRGREWLSCPALEIRTRLAGLHQVENSSLAVSGAFLLSSQFGGLTCESIVTGVSRTEWPGRFEIVDDSPVTILDGAHNTGGVARLVENIKSMYAGRTVGLVYGCMKDKPYNECLSMLREAGSRLWCTQVPGNPRSAAAETLARAAIEAGWGQDDVLALPDPIEALREARLASEVAVCCGSLYLVGFTRPRLRRLLEEGAV